MSKNYTKLIRDNDLEFKLPIFTSHYLFIFTNEVVKAPKPPHINFSQSHSSRFIPLHSLTSSENT